MIYLYILCLFNIFLSGYLMARLFRTEMIHAEKLHLLSEQMAYHDHKGEETCKPRFANYPPFTAPPRNNKNK